MQGISQDEVELEKSVRRLREKFYGKISIKNAVKLMRRFANDHDLVCSYIISCTNETEDLDSEEGESLDGDPVALKVIEKLNREEEEEEMEEEEMEEEMEKEMEMEEEMEKEMEKKKKKKEEKKKKKKEEKKKKKQKSNNKTDEKIKEVAQQLKVLPLTHKNLQMFENAQKNCIPSEDRQFACQSCDNMWWRRVSERKQVSRCHKCGTRYDPVPKDKMWGKGQFSCPTCKRTFSGSAQMGMPSPCYSCLNPVLPSFIIPPRRTTGPRSRQQHSCFAEDCYNRREPHIPGTHCTHPRSLKRNGLPKVIFPSPVHESTGSTVATCLSQGSLAGLDIDDLILDDLNEAGEEEEEDDDDDDDD